MPQIQGTTRGDFGFEYGDCSRMSRRRVHQSFLVGLESERERSSTEHDRRSCFDFTACITEENGKLALLPSFRGNLTIRIP